MRKLDRSVILSVLCLAGVAAASLVACSTTDASPGSEPGILDEGGITPNPDGSRPDGSVVDPPKKCAKAADCPSGVCNLATGLCAGAACKDGTKNGNETDVDCGGDCAQCDTEKTCKVGADCTSRVCKNAGTGLKCQAPTNTDGVKNGNETGIDCGGTANPKCGAGQDCKVREDCTSDYCKANKCTAISAADGVKNGTETDIDCGGAGNARCADALKCLVDGDCNSDVCMNPDGLGLKCQMPTPTDGKKNGTETDVDCGGGGANPACATGLKCLVGGDCATLGCNYLFKCAAGRSCTNPGGYGADTCGLGGEGRAEIVAEKAWEDCCARLPVTPASGPTAGQVVMTNKYQVTAGRMRVFLESVGYNVRAFVQGARAAGQIPLVPGQAVRTVLEPSWDMHLPTSFAGNQNADEIADCAQGSTTTPTGNTCKPDTEQAGIYTSVRNQLGGIIFKGNNQTSTGCFVGAGGADGGGTHAFRFPDAQQDGLPPAHGQNLYDTKSMQCIPYLMAQAFCVWDGGRLELTQEWAAAWGGGAMPWSAEFPAATPVPRSVGSSTYWGCRFPWATDADQSQCATKWTAPASIEFADFQYSYEYPKLVNFDFIVFISAPGRTRGRGPAGHADVIGNNYGLSSNVGYNDDPFVATHGWNASGSWEVHGYSKALPSGQSRISNLLNKYGKLGLRCAYP